MPEQQHPVLPLVATGRLSTEELKRRDAYQQDARNVETGLLKVVLTLAGGTLALSIGFVLGERRVDIPLPVIPTINKAWVCLLVSMGAAVTSWLLTVLSMFNLSKLQNRPLPTQEPSSWRLRLSVVMDFIATALVPTCIVLCIAGLALLGRAALALLETVGSSIPLAT